ncbi:hypothetical protein ACYOEI_23680 [Singulisphaera rosea]
MDSRRLDGELTQPVTITETAIDAHGRAEEYLSDALRAPIGSILHNLGL